jgi:hypothetical protein
LPLRERLETTDDTLRDVSDREGRHVRHASIMLAVGGAGQVSFPAKA